MQPSSSAVSLQYPPSHPHPAPSPSSLPKSYLRLGLLLGGWYLVSAASNILNKLFLVKDSDFALSSLALIFLQVNVSILCAGVAFVTKIDKFEWVDSAKLVRCIFPLATGFLLTIAMSYFALESISVSLSATIKGLAPFFNAAISRVAFGERHSTSTYMSLGVVVCGVVLTTMTELEFDLFGAMSAVAATVILVLQNIYSKRVISSDGIPPAVTHAYISATCSVVLLVVILIVEPHTLHELVPAFTTFDVAMKLLFNSLSFFLHVALAFRVIEAVDTPLTYAVGNTLKRIVIIASSIVFFGQSLNLLNVVGMLVAVGGGMLYSLARQNESGHTQKPKKEVNI